MATPANGPPFDYRFADLAIDVARRCVLRDGQPIKLKTLDFDLLRFLVEQAPNVVSADMLAEKVWGRHFVSPENVSQRIMRLRQSLADDANQPRYIETVRNKGHRLIPVVQTVSTEPSPSGRPDRPAVAVLPFDNLSPDPKDAYFAIGIHDQILSQLTQLGRLRVASRTSVQCYADTQKSVAEIARELGVATVLDGSVSYSDGRVRVTAHLSDGVTNENLWSGSYEHAFNNIFATQSSIALAVAEALTAELLPAERELVARRPTASVRAYNLYLSAVARRFRDSRDELLLAIDELEQAVALDENFTSAWVLYANLRTTAQFFDPARGDEHRAAGERAARRALAIDPELGDAHAALGYALGFRKDWKGGEQAYREAARLRVPRGSMHAYAVLKLAVADFAAAREILDEAWRAEPGNGTVLRFLMHANASLGEWTTAVALYDTGKQLFASWRQSDSGMMHWRVGRNELAAARAVPPEGAINTAMIERLDAPEAALAELHRLYATSGPGNPDVRRDIALWAAHFGDTALAIDAMRAAISEQCEIVLYVWLPQFRPVRQLLEFKALLRDVGIVAHWQAYGWPAICRPVLDRDDFDCG